MKSLFKKLGLASILLALFIGCVQPPAAPNGEIETSDEAGNTVTTQAVPTNGLKGEYYDNVDFTGTLKTRYDANVNRTWNASAPITGIQPTTYSVRWTGQVMPAFSQTYTFFVTSSDGARLMVNGQVLVNDWVDGSSRVRSGTVALQANTKYDIRLEYYRNATNAGAVKLEWQSSSRARQVVPQASLFPTIFSLIAGREIPYTVSADFKNWVVIAANDNRFSTVTQGNATVDATGRAYLPVQLMDAQGRTVAADLVILGTKESLAFTPASTAEYFVLSSPVFYGWTAKARLAVRSRVPTHAQFSNLVESIRSASTEIDTNGAMDIADRIAFDIAKDRIAELRQQRNLPAISGTVRPQRIDSNFPTAFAPPLIGRAVTTQSGKFFQVTNQSLLNWNVFKVRSSQYQTPPELTGFPNSNPTNPPVENDDGCPDPRVPVCYNSYGIDSTFSLEGIPILDAVIAQYAAPSTSKNFRLYDCSSHALALSATVWQKLDFLDPAVQNYLGMINSVLGIVGEELPTQQVGGGTYWLRSAILAFSSLDVIKNVQQLLAQASDNPVAFVQLTRYLYETLMSTRNTAGAIEDWRSAIYRYGLPATPNQVTKRIERNVALKLVNLTETAFYWIQFFGTLKTERLDNAYFTSKVTYDKILIKTSKDRVDEQLYLNQSGTQDIQVENSFESECSLTYTFKLSSAPSAVEVKTTLIPVLSEAIGPSSGRLRVADVATIRLDYKCPPIAGTFDGVLEITHSATSPTTPIKIPISLKCAAPKISVTPNPLELITTINSSVTENLTISNDGDAPLEISSIVPLNSWLSVGPNNFLGANAIPAKSSKVIAVTAVCPANLGKSFGKIRFESNSQVNLIDAVVTLDCREDNYLVFQKMLFLGVGGNCWQRALTVGEACGTGTSKANISLTGRVKVKLYDGASYNRYNTPYDLDLVIRRDNDSSIIFSKKLTITPDSVSEYFDLGLLNAGDYTTTYTVRFSTPCPDSQCSYSIGLRGVNYTE